jgi:FMN phosphatase YigB (HAD superfamily)
VNYTELHKAIGQERERIVNHPLYTQLQDIKDLQTFTEYHVFAVWDFMSLLKSLQRQLTCVSNPWVPVGSANTRFLVNEIVTGEESDVDQEGNRISHFELYLRAMQEMNADTSTINNVLAQLSKGKDVAAVLSNADIPQAIKAFCGFTFDIIENAPVHVQAAVFTFGREDLIPDMFHEMVIRLSQQYPTELKTFRYYLERHIEVDGDHHSKLALQMVEELCGNDTERWQEATEACVKALTLRRELWDGVLKEVTGKI